MSDAERIAKLEADLAAQERINDRDVHKYLAAMKRLLTSFQVQAQDARDREDYDQIPIYEDAVMRVEQEIARSMTPLDDDLPGLLDENEALEAKLAARPHLYVKQNGLIGVRPLATPCSTPQEMADCRSRGGACL